MKLDIQCIDTVSVGLFLLRLHKGSNIQIEQVRVNDEVWLPRHVALKLDARLALLKGVNIAEDVTYRDYKKFRTDTKILPVGRSAGTALKDVGPRATDRAVSLWIFDRRSSCHPNLDPLNRPSRMSSFSSSRLVVANELDV